MDESVKWIGNHEIIYKAIQINCPCLYSRNAWQRAECTSVDLCDGGMLLGCRIDYQESYRVKYEILVVSMEDDVERSSQDPDADGDAQPGPRGKHSGDRAGPRPGHRGTCCRGPADAELAARTAAAGPGRARAAA